jgi:hypothetical protein
MSGFERRALQVAVAIGSLIPIAAGAAGVVLGPSILRSVTSATGDLDSHFRYLSGLLLGIGCAYASTIPRIETQGARFRLLTCLVVVGGIGRLVSLVAIGVPSPVMMAALVMELVITPSLALWQLRLAYQMGVRAAWAAGSRPQRG